MKSTHFIQFEFLFMITFSISFLHYCNETTIREINTTLHQLNVQVAITIHLNICQPYKV